MQPKEILPDLFFIQRGYLNANHFVYRCDRPVLIDTGYVADFAATEKLIRASGADPARTSLIINTHTHCDHLGGNLAIQEMSGCQVAMHRIAKQHMDQRDGWSTWWSYFGQEAEFCDCTRALHDGDEVGVGPYRFRVIHTPGHAAEGIVLYEPNHKLLISSDTLWKNDLAVINPRIEGSAAVFQALDSLDKLSGLEVDTAYPGHGPAFDDFTAALDRARRRYEGYLKEPRRVGEDLLKRITCYTLLMHPGLERDRFLDHLMGVPWFPETVDLFFSGDYAGVLRDTMDALVQRGAVEVRQGRLYATMPA